MISVPHPEVLLPDYVPPVPFGRSGELARLRRWLGDPFPVAPRPWAAAVVGPRGSGTSVVARAAARGLLEAVRRESPGPTPRLLTARVRACRSAHAVATALLAQMDDGFHGRGFRAIEVAAGVLRRIRRDAAPTVIVLDDIGPGVGELTDLLRAFLRPARFLPEGGEELPPLWLIIAGVPEATGTWSRSASFGLRIEQTVRLPPYDAGQIERIVRDRAGRALGREAPLDLVARVTGRAVTEGTGAARAVDLLRRALVGNWIGDRLDGPASEDRRPIEPRILRALNRAGAHRGARLGEVRFWEARYAEEEGDRPMAPTTLWRRIVRLEAEGVVRRQVRTGGAGGTESIVELVEPGAPLPLTAPRPETHRAGDAASGPLESWKEPQRAAP
ncbi:MAG TPA: hypothetical protein VFF67_06260 [Thermoplasmata archaeon]|nr:hypothetical protein [Thermoplasmata archaeon]